MTKKPIEGIDHIDFTHCPDIAQTVAVTCALLGRSCDFSGLESLRIKETDRIDALQRELAKIHAGLEERKAGVFTLIPSKQLPNQVKVHTYDDHRMAMAFMPLMTKMEVVFDDPEVVNKSYPSFWKHVALLGVKPLIQQ